jgi:hypothetical protein
MGISIEQWRVRIGSFTKVNNKTIKGKNIDASSHNKFVTNPSAQHFESNILKCFVILSIIVVLLVISGLETNPGPNDDFDVESNNSDELSINDLRGASQDTNLIISTLSKLFISGKAETLKAVNDLSEKFDRELAAAKQEISELKKSNNVMQDKIDQLENENRKNNIVVFGLVENEGNDSFEDFRILAETKLDVVISKEEVDQAYRIGNLRGQRPIMICFSQYKSKITIMQNVGKLKGSQISISDDLTPKARTIKKRLLKCAKEARDFGYKVKMRDRALIINDVKLGIEELNQTNWLSIYNSKKSRQDSDAGEGGRKRQREKSLNSDFDDNITGEGSSSMVSGNELFPPLGRGGNRSRTSSLSKKSKKT